MYANVLLEHEIVYSERDAGKAEARFESAWKREWDDAEFEAAIADKPPASPLCSHCGLDTLRAGGSWVGISDTSRLFCGRPACRAALQAYVAELGERQKKHEEDVRRQQTARQAEQAERVNEARTGFHWRDNWYFKRLESGSVRVSRIDGKYVFDILIPENEWASIVCSVSLQGETGERWQQQRVFHNGSPS